MTDLVERLLRSCREEFNPPPAALERVWSRVARQAGIPTRPRMTLEQRESAFRIWAAFDTVRRELEKPTTED